MSIATGQTLTDLISQASAELGDSAHRRWSADTLQAFINEALRRLADTGAFRRTDLHPARSGQPVYRTFAEVVRIDRVLFAGSELTSAYADEMERRHGRRWRSRNGSPRRYLALNDGVRIFPAPDVSAPALTLPASPLLSEADGAKIDGNGWCGASGDGVIVHFREDDPDTPDFEGEGVVRIDYAYYPRPSSMLDRVPTRLAELLRRYLLYRCLASSEVPEEVEASQLERALWLQEHQSVAANSNEAARSRDNWFAPMQAR
jgi:hypothetical protein